MLACGTLAAGDDTYSERAAKVETLTAAEKTELLRKKQRFDDLSADEKTRLRELHESLSAAPDSQELQKLMDRYCNWLKNLSSAERAEVLTLPADKRIARIKEIVSRQEGQRFTEYVNFQLPKEDRDAIYKWLDEFVEVHEKKIIDRLRDDDRRRIRDIDDPRARRRTLIQRLPIRRFDPKMPYPSKEETSQIVENLSPETRKWLEAVSADKRSDRARELVGAAIMSIAFPPPSEEDLRKFYTSLPTEDRARLDAMDSEQMQRELRFRYRAEHFQGQGWGGGRGGPPREGDRREGDRRGDGSREGPGPGPPPPPGLASPR